VTALDAKLLEADDAQRALHRRMVALSVELDEQMVTTAQGGSINAHRLETALAAVIEARDIHRAHLLTASKIYVAMRGAA
jgi:hypothetical protein